MNDDLTALTRTATKASHSHNLSNSPSTWRANVFGYFLNQLFIPDRINSPPLVNHEARLHILNASRMSLHSRTRFSWLAVFRAHRDNLKDRSTAISVALLSRTVVVGVTHCAVELQEYKSSSQRGARSFVPFHGMIGNLSALIVLLTVAGFTGINSANFGYGTALNGVAHQ